MAFGGVVTCKGRPEEAGDVPREAGAGGCRGSKKWGERPPVRRWLPRAGALFGSLTCRAGRQGARGWASHGATTVLLSRLGWPMSRRDSWRRGCRVLPPSWKSGLARPAVDPPEVLLWGTGMMWSCSGHPLKLSLCGHVGQRRGELPFLEVPRLPASEEHDATAEQDTGECQHSQHSPQDHTASPCGDPLSVGMGTSPRGTPSGDAAPQQGTDTPPPCPQAPSLAHTLGQGSRCQLCAVVPYLPPSLKSSAGSRALPSPARSDTHACGCTPAMREESVRAADTP